MAMIKCEECDHSISDKAERCISCGYPANEESTKQAEMSGAWSAVTRSRTPINLFAIAMMCCASILGMSATQIDSPESLKAFTYTLHVFMAVTGMFFVTILFCRKGVYHPDDLAKAKRDGLSDEMGSDQPVIAAVVIIIMLSAYAAFQAVYAN